MENFILCVVCVQEGRRIFKKESEYTTQVQQDREFQRTYCFLNQNTFFDKSKNSSYSIDIIWHTLRQITAMKSYDKAFFSDSEQIHW